MTKQDNFTNEVRKRIPWNKGKYNIYSEETISKMRKAKLGKPSPKKGKTYDQIYGTEKAQRLKESNSNYRKGKTYEERFGKERANEIKIKMGNKHKGCKIWNKGLTKETDLIVAKIAQSKQGKVSKMKGKKLIEIYGEEKAREIGNKISRGNSGKTPSIKTRETLSKALQGKNVGINNGMFGKCREKHPNWLGGKSFEPYTLDFNKQFKEAIRIRDNYTCQLCSIFEDDHLILYNGRLHIHHIDYNKKNSFPQNCIALCLRCNLLVNKDRELWTKHFQDLLKKLYGYEYTQDQKIILDFTES